MDTLLVLNAGSSSLKFRVFEDTAALTLLAHGQVKAISSVAPIFEVTLAQNGIKNQTTLQAGSKHEQALKTVLGWIEQGDRGWKITTNGHRVVHGGTRHPEPVVITDDVVEYLRSLIPLAPLHAPHNISGMEIMATLKPGVPQVACFDTSFHAHQNPLFSTFAIPDFLREKGVRRYGFHGLSYEWIAGALKEKHPDLYAGKVVVGHLGAGASLCAMDNGKSIATTMGMTALDGLVMGTRCGNIDPGVLIYMMRDLSMSADEIERVLYKESGLKALSGGESEVANLLASDDPRAQFAIDYFVMRTVRFIGMMAASLGGMDALVFTGGIGENAAIIRDAITEKLSFMKPFTMLAIPTNEELMIARHTRACLGKGT